LLIKKNLKYHKRYKKRKNITRKPNKQQIGDKLKRLVNSVIHRKFRHLRILQNSLKLPNHKALGVAALRAGYLTVLKTKFKKMTLRLFF